ncbi:SOR/SNZ family-domain-containing protein [Kickxella alabastrina]|uniref:SOR/SNZ family-domain-containing protein n=1 Tax=Kickxella alabastrina TaxID=61397 RepID=UPI00221E7130|nr:SOR/SNZ family-domain-containing protein [Kickxella alabastrina]KAI7832045.1 SOR/SNZ family-domain-containing protein [Kickxella alabastrina]
MSANNTEFNEEKKFKHSLVDQLKNSVILEATILQQAHIGQEAGISAIIAMADHYNTNMSSLPDPDVFARYIDAVALPIIGCVRPGHVVEAFVLESFNIDCIEESENMDHGILDKRQFVTPLIPIENIAEKVYGILKGIRDLKNNSESELLEMANDVNIPLELIMEIRDKGKTPADAACFMECGCDGIILSSSTTKVYDPVQRIAALVKAVNNYKNVDLIAEMMLQYEYM